MGLFSFLFAGHAPTREAPQKPPLRFYKKYDEIPTDYTVIDVETSGLDPCTAEILEIAAIKVRNNIEVDRYHSYIRPVGAISPSASQVNGLTWSKLYNKPSLECVQPCFFHFIGDDILVGHNIGFDIRFIQTRCETYLDNECFDTLKWSKLAFPDAPDHKLDTLRYALDLHGDSHTALGDCIATHQLLQCIANSYTITNMLENGIEPHTLSYQTYTQPVYDDHGYSLWAEGETARVQGDFDKAFELFKNAESKGYNRPSLFISYAKIYRKQREYEKEIAIMDKGLSLFTGQTAQDFEYRKHRAQELMIAQQKREEMTQEKNAIREAKAEERRKKAEMAASKPKRPRGRPVAQCLDDGTIVKEYESISAAAKEVGISDSSIRDAANGKQHHACGFCWKYIDVSKEV